MANYLNRCNETLMPQAAEFTMNKHQLINLTKFFSVFTGGRSITDPVNPPPEGQTMQNYYTFVENTTMTADMLRSHVRANMVQAAKVLDLALGEAQKTKTERDTALLEVEQWTQAHETLRAERDSLKEELDKLNEKYEEVYTEKEKVKEEAQLAVFNKQAELDTLNDQLLSAREGQDQVKIKQLSDLMLQTQKEINALKAELEDVETTENRDERVLTKNRRFDIKLDKNLPKFGGNTTDNYDDWIFLVESYQRFNGVQDEQMMGLILPLVRGQALQILKRMLLTEIDVSWSSYKKELKLTYQTDTKSRKLRKELKELKQGNDFDGFLTKFRTLTNQLPDMSEKEMLEHFIDALKPKLRYELIKDKIENLQEAMRTARIFEECHNNFNEIRNELKTVNLVESKEKYDSKFKNKNFNRYKNLNNNANNNKNKYEKNNDSSDNESDEDEDEDIKSRSRQRNTYVSRIKCYGCGKEGHLKKDCWSENNTRKVNIVNVESVHQVNLVLSNELPDSRGTVNGVELKTILDSGASVSLMSNKCAKRNGFEVKPSSTKIKLATDGVESVIGETEYLVVEMGGTRCYENFLVVESSNELILGLTWFRKTNVFFRPADGKIIKENVITENEEIQDVLVMDTLDNEAEENNEWDFKDPSEFKQIEIRPEIKLHKMQMMKLTVLMEKVSELFATSLEDLKPCNVMEHVVKVDQDSPKYVPPYRKSIKEEEMIEEEVEKLLKCGIIEELINSHELVEMYGVIQDNEFELNNFHIEKMNTTNEIRNIKVINFMKNMFKSILITLVIIIILIFIATIILFKCNKSIKHSITSTFTKNKETEVIDLEKILKTDIKPIRL